MTFHDTPGVPYDRTHPTRHPDRPKEPALSLSKGAEGSRLGLPNKHPRRATRFLRYAAQRAAPVGMTAR